jgi:hypothetical protein
MRIDKIEASRNNQAKVDGPIRIGTAPRFLSVVDSQISSGTGKVNVVEVDFEYFTNYDPGLGSIRVDGVVWFQDSDEKRKAILAGWKNDRKLPQEFSTEVLAQLTQRSMLISMILAREMSLPSPLPLKINQQEGQQAAAGE